MKNSQDADPEMELLMLASRKYLVVITPMNVKIPFWDNAWKVIMKCMKSFFWDFCRCWLVNVEITLLGQCLTCDSDLHQEQLLNYHLLFLLA